MTASKMKVWPGPRILVPMATDVLLVGDADLPIPGNRNTGTFLSLTQPDYQQLFTNLGTGELTYQPFEIASSTNHLKTGAHLMWTLPHDLRKGHQVKGPDGNVSTEFPLVPNRWLVTRYEYDSLTDGSAPKVESHVVISDEITAPPPGALNPNKSQYPTDTIVGAESVSYLGTTVPITNWNGENLADNKHIKLKAVGPGNVSWSVTYDNIRDVFGFYDQSLSKDATRAKPVYYSYQIIGWYDMPENDRLFDISIKDAKTWQAALEGNYKWQIGDGTPSDVADAVQDWKTWEKDHGLGSTFAPPNTLAPQEKDAITAWHNWQQLNGEKASQSDYARQILCHSMISKVVWQGFDQSYKSGNPYKPESGTLPSVSAGNNAIDAISTFLATKIIEGGPTKKDESSIPVLARALEAFQKDLLEDYGKDPVKVENQLHAAHFSKKKAGSQWIVVRIESEDNEDVLPSVNAGKQSIPLNKVETDLLTTLNNQQRSLNKINAIIDTQRGELFRLHYKQYIINNRLKPPPIDKIPEQVMTQVKESIQALSTELSLNIGKAGKYQVEIDSNKVKLEGQSGFKDDYDLKQVDIDGYSAPLDPVIMVAGAGLDTKFAEQVVTLANGHLKVRYTGQTVSEFQVSYGEQGKYKTVNIAAGLLLSKVVFPEWNAIPKEVMSLWLEALIIDDSTAAMLAVIFFEENKVSSSFYNTVHPPKTQTPLQELTSKIAKKQTAIWNPTKEIGYSDQALLEAMGMNGTAPSRATMAYWQQQPWTPVFMDWKIKWFPTSKNSTKPFGDDDWKLDEIDYGWDGTSIKDDLAITFEGRSILNPGIAKNIQEKIETYKVDNSTSNPLDNFPEWLIKDLEEGKKLVGKFDILTQSISGFTENLITKAAKGSRTPTDSDALVLLQHDYERHLPVLGPEKKSEGGDLPQPNFPIRSGHFQILDVWVVDAYGQIMFSKIGTIDSDPNKPLDNVMWSESLATPGVNFKKTYGQLAPRVSQQAKSRMDLLKKDDDSIISNSADATSPICGWVMPNHLDNSLIVFNAAGNNLGSVIKVQSEATKDNWSIRWDAAPGTNLPLGAPPAIINQHLKGFVNGLLATGIKGANAYDNFKAAIDSALWTLSDYGKRTSDNLSLLVGRPLAVVRSQVGIDLAGDPTYPQSWWATGQYYNQKGKYSATPLPFQSIPMSLRVGDAYIVENGVMGYFESDNYDVFYPVYGANGQTKTIQELMRSGLSLDFVPPDDLGKFTSDYVTAGHTVQLTPNAETKFLTMLVDPVGSIPIFTGSFPYTSKRLPNGPVVSAMNNLNASFRVGPVMMDPNLIKMPTPAEIKGNWSWRQRKDTSSWNDPESIKSATSVSALSGQPLRLTEGWLDLSNIKEDPS